MKKVSFAMIIILVLATFALPVFAEKEGVGVHAGITLASSNPRITSPGDQDRQCGGNETCPVPTTNRETGAAQGKGSEADNNKNQIVRNISGVREDHDRSLENLNATLRNMSADQREQFKNENEVRLAVHTLLDMENLTGGIGRNVSAIARDFNNSESSRRQLEERIQTRNSFIRLLFGGDRDAGQELANLTARNTVRIAGLHQLMNSTTLDPEVRVTMEEQVRTLQKEQDRLAQLATREQQDRGLFGWL